ncbi:MAG: hypothetical protein GXP29_13500 [Planctomycetes bacterium]|nr:hypothetical protein [Planctomycetota bacterium]
MIFCLSRCNGRPFGASLVMVVCAWAGVAQGFDPLAGDYTRDDPLDVRIVTYNHNRNFIDDSNTDAEFNRILIALDPDIICFQEFPSGISVSDIENRMDGILPTAGGWQVHFGLFAGIRTVLVSRFPLTIRRTDTIPASSTRGVTIALADLPDADYSRDVYLLGVHLKCCGNAGGSEDQKRQDSADAIANWLGDARGVARASGNNIVLPTDTPMVVLGDFNMVGGPQPEDTITTGNIQDEGMYGVDVSGDWDVSDITNLMPADPFTGDTFTWQGSGQFAPSALDRIFYTDSIITVANSFILNTNTMTGSALAAAGLQSGDTLASNSSDHLPVVVDLRFGLGCSIDPDCDDGIFCNGAETCDGNGACQSGTPIDCNDGVSCTVDFCNEITTSCDNLPNDASCNDGAFCNGVETCNAVSDCQPGTPVNCDDGVTCTLDACNEGTNSCDNTPNQASCDDGAFCNGVEVCNAVSDCQPGTPVNCDDGVTCTNDSCNEGTNSCDNAPVDSNCDNNLFCDGTETCDPLLDCVTGSPPCMGATWCNETNDSCVAFGNGDFEPDGDVDLIDYAAFMICFGQAADGGCEPANISGDEMVDLNDLALFVAQLGGPS